MAGQGTGAKAIGFDCFPERAAKKQSYLPSEFVVHEIIGDSGAILMQTLTNLGELPSEGPIHVLRGLPQGQRWEGAPTRFFAIIE